MAFVKKTWKDRIAEFPTRRRLTKEDNTSELVTVAREEGTLSQEGDAFSAENMNDLENRIDAEFTEVNGKLANISVIYLGTATVTVNNDSTAILTHNLNITGNYGIQVMCTSNINVVFSYAIDKNRVGLAFYDTGMLPIGSGTRTVNYIIFA